VVAGISRPCPWHAAQSGCRARNACRAHRHRAP
jgi:hypothetical protein